MKCYRCNCPGAILDFNLVHCWNIECRNFFKDILEKSEFDWYYDTVNGDPVEWLRDYLGKILENEFIL